MDLQTMYELAIQFDSYKKKCIEDLYTVLSMDVPVTDKLYVLQEIYIMYDDIMNEIEIQMDLLKQISGETDKNADD